MGAYIVFQRLRDREGAPPHALDVGHAELVRGRVRFSDAGLEEVVTSIDVHDPHDPGRVLRPADGRAYLDALPSTFAGDHFWAMRVYEIDATPSYEERKGPEQ
jgi:hypothetical protein